MNKLKHLIAHVIMSAMYDREPELHPQDAYGMASKMIEQDSSVKNLIIYIVSKRFSFKNFALGVLVGLVLALIMIEIRL